MLEKSENGGGVAIFVKDSYSFKQRDDLSINCEAIKSLSIEITNNQSKNAVFNVVCRSPNGDIDFCKNYFKNIFFKDNVISKNILITGDFDINLKTKKKVQNFINLIFQFGLVPTTKKPRKVTKNTISAIDHIIASSIINIKFKYLTISQ